MDFAGAQVAHAVVLAAGGKGVELKDFIPKWAPPEPVAPDVLWERIKSIFPKGD